MVLSKLALDIANGDRCVSDLTDLELMVLRAETSGKLTNITKANPNAPFSYIDNDLSSMFVSFYRTLVDDVCNIILKSFSESTSFDDIISIIDSKFDNIGTLKKQELMGAIAASYFLVKTNDINDINDISDFDLFVVNSTTKDQLYWFNSYYRRFMREHISDIIRTYMNSSLNRNLLKNSIVMFLKSTLLGNGNIEKNQWANRPFDYYKSNVKLAITRTRVFSLVHVLEQAGVKKYRIIHRKEIECDFCKQINGTELDVVHGVNLMNKILKAEGVGAVKDIVSWTHGEDLKVVLESTNPLEHLIEGGLVLPPYHFGCTGDIEAVS